MFQGIGDQETTMGNATRTAILCAAILSACTTVKPHETQGYRDGYIAGCSSGQVYAGKPGPEAPRDDTRYGVDPQYTQGWKDGQNECYAEAMATPQSWGGR